MKTDKQDIRPVCPFCEAQLDRLVEVKGGWFSDKRVYCCPLCHKILGINFRMP